MGNVKFGCCPICQTKHEYHSYCGGTYAFFCKKCEVTYYGELVFQTSFVSSEKEFVSNEELDKSHGSLIAPVSDCR